MDNQFGSDFITFEVDGVEYELEVISTLEYNGFTYLATVPASDEWEPEILYFRQDEDEEGGLLCFIEDEQERETIDALFTEAFFAAEEDA